VAAQRGLRMAAEEPTSAPAAAPLSLTQAAATGAPASPSLDLTGGDKLVAAYDVVICSASSAIGGK
jgi:hypothetical protein